MWDREADVVIVGTGWAGLAAAITARELGLSVLLLDKMRIPGGNSLIAMGGVNAADPQRQGPQGVEDSPDLHYKHTIEGGDAIGDPEKVRYLVDHALEDAVHYMERLGVVWPDTVTWQYGAMWTRTHVPPSYTDRAGKRWVRGAALIHAQLDRLQELGQEIMLRHRVTRVLRETPLAGRVQGVEVEVAGASRLFGARKAVILASGGFAANLAWVSLHDRRLAETDTTNHPCATGECIKLAQDIGAETVHMDYIQAIPEPVRLPFQAMFFQVESEEIRRASGGMTHSIFINRDGRRFVNEGERRDVIKFAACAQPLFDPLPPTEANLIEELEGKLQITQGNLVATVGAYNAACQAQCDPEFGKHPSLLVPLLTGPFKATSKAMKRHHTMGGLLVQGTTGQVIDRHGRAIPGLYAAGEITAGTHGANRLGHNATPNCLVFGQVCARTVAGVGG